jgi:hypothetical protein
MDLHSKSSAMMLVHAGFNFVRNMVAVDFVAGKLGLSRMEQEESAIRVLRGSVGWILIAVATAADISTDAAVSLFCGVAWKYGLSRNHSAAESHFREEFVFYSVGRAVFDLLVSQSRRGLVNSPVRELMEWHQTIGCHEFQ